MPSKNMLPKGQRRRTVRPEYVATRGVDEPTPLPVPIIEFDELEEDADAAIRTFTADPAAANLRLDQYLAQALPDISRARVQLLIEAGQVRIDGNPAKPKQRLRGGESIEIEGSPQPAPLHAVAEDIPLDILHEDRYLAVVNKPAGMMVHAGSGATEDARNRGTLVNALLHHMRELSSSSGPLRPGIVHRLDKQTSGLIVVAKNDVAHARLASMFSRRQVRKLYLTLVQGELPGDSGTVNASISRDTIRRTRMTTRREGGRTAVSHWQVLRRIRGPYGSFTLASVRIETGRTHQIRVHMASLGHPVVGDTLYGASTAIVPLAEFARLPRLALQRNFLHAAELEFPHPVSSERITLVSNLPPDLKDFMARLASTPAAGSKSVEGMYLDK
jgi:23S rRNA pseudouridine1911/1915/1917 synthase